MRLRLEVWRYSFFQELTEFATIQQFTEAEWRICVSKIIIIGSDNGLTPGRCQATIWTNAGILLIGPLGINFRESIIEIYTFSFNKTHLKMSSGNWQPFCLGLNVLRGCLFWGILTNYPLSCWFNLGKLQCNFLIWHSFFKLYFGCGFCMGLTARTFLHKILWESHNKLLLPRCLSNFRATVQF